MKNIEFRAICLQNLEAVIELQVRDDQAGLVADNLYSIAQAGIDPAGNCRAAYLDDQPIGFFYTRSQHEGRSLYLCRFMIDRRRQGRGFGRKVMHKLVGEAFLSPQLAQIDLAVSREPGSAEGFYRKCGFVPTEERYQGGWRMVLSRERHLGSLAAGDD